MCGVCGVRGMCVYVCVMYVYVFMVCMWYVCVVCVYMFMVCVWYVCLVYVWCVYVYVWCMCCVCVCVVCVCMCMWCVYVCVCRFSSGDGTKTAGSQWSFILEKQAVVCRLQLADSDLGH